MIKIKPFRQTPGLCGPASLKMVLDYYGVSVSEAELAKAAGATKGKGVSKKGLKKAAEHFGFKLFLKKNSSLQDLKYFIKKKIPVIIDWFFEDDGHYSVVVDINKKKVVIMDPSLKKGIREFSTEKFLRVWFDFSGDYIKKPKNLVLRLMLVITPKNYGCI